MKDVEDENHDEVLPSLMQKASFAAKVKDIS